MCPQSLQQLYPKLQLPGQCQVFHTPVLYHFSLNALFSTNLHNSSSATFLSSQLCEVPLEFLTIKMVFDLSKELCVICKLVISLLTLCLMSPPMTMSKLTQQWFLGTLAWSPLT